MPVVRANINAADVLRTRADTPWALNDFGRVDFSPRQASTVSGVTNDEVEVYT